jgi:aspartyl-tRNA(Asn)/glutamyl-tRNA(Gln) amidotransferase subunit C
MKPVSKEVLKTAASKMMFEMDDNQYDQLIKELNIFLKQVDLIGDIPRIDEVTPMTFPFEVTNSYLREDEVEEPLSQEEALKNASDVKDGQIRLPKVV